MYQNLSLRKRDCVRQPGFQILRNRTEEDFRYFWQAVKRGKLQLEGLHVLCTDKDKAITGGILQKMYGIIHLLGLEQVQDRIERKLTELIFLFDKEN